MDFPGLESTQTYKIKLASGRVLGPLDLDRIRLLILKKQITGVEVAREYPKGDWKDINQIAAISELLISNIAGNLKAPEGEHQVYNSTPGGTDIIVTDSNILPGATKVLSENAMIPLPELDVGSKGVKTPEGTGKGSKVTGDGQGKGSKSIGSGLKLDLPPEVVEDEDKTMMNVSPSGYSKDEDEKTRVASMDEDEHTRLSGINTKEDISADSDSIQLESASKSVQSEPSIEFKKQQHVDISSERTVVFQRSTNSPNVPGKKRLSKKELIQGIVIAFVLCTVVYDTFFAEVEKPAVLKNEPIRPQLPDYISGKSDVNKSMEIYGEAMKYYVADTVEGYRMAANRLRGAASYDVSNVKALAILASSYLNLIDSSNKDENFFSVISKLIDMSRAKAVDLPETVIADVEFFLVVNKAEAAQNRIVEYTQTHQNYGPEMFYYLALAFYGRGDFVSAAKYLGQFPENKIFSAKIYYLRGLIAEKLNDLESAMKEYTNAYKFNNRHAKSRLKIAQMLSKQGQLKEASVHVDFLISHMELLTPLEAGRVYYLHCQLAELYQKWDLALGDVERAVKLEPENHDYLLELYTLRARAGDSLQTVQKQARMYYYLGEGEKLIQAGKYQDAMIPLLQARQANDESPLPPIKIGDMFNNLHDVENAKNNYKLAAERAPNSIEVWSKYIDILIQSYEWEDAKKAMDKFRSLPVSQSAIDKAAADMYQKQGRYLEAQTFYKKAMARDTIDSAVYIAYAKSLMTIKNYKDAPFFFALALRFDPLNVDVTINIAKCVAETESIDRAINMLQDELQRGNGARAEYLAAIAEFQIQKGSWPQAQATVEQAMQANPQYAYPWKLQGQLYLNREGQDREALDKAAFAYKSYSERNASDPIGYLERYKIFLRKSEFEKAKEELNKIYEIYPKYPKLHYYLGALYVVQGNHKVAAEEFKLELQNNPESVETLISYGKELMEGQQAMEALKQFTKAMQKAPTSAEAKQNAGWANRELKNYQAAVTLIKAAISIDKANPIYYKRLGLTYKEMSDSASACGMFKKYLEMEPDATDKADYSFCF